jgi:hypothetical protein
MTIHETKDTIIRWIKTCDKEEQIDQMVIWVIDQLIVNKFEKTVPVITMEIIKELLVDEMEIQRKVINKKQPDTHEKYDYE